MLCGLVQRQQKSPLPDLPLQKDRLHGEHADHFEAASWNGPAHAEWKRTLEETPAPKG